MKEESKNSWFFANVCHYEDTRHFKEIGQFLGNDSALFASSDIIQRRWQVSIHWRISHQLLEHKRTKKKKKVVKNLSSLLTKDSMHFFPPRQDNVRAAIQIKVISASSSIYLQLYYYNWTRL